MMCRDIISYLVSRIGINTAAKYRIKTVVDGNNNCFYYPQHKEWYHLFWHYYFEKDIYGDDGDMIASSNKETIIRFIKEQQMQRAIAMGRLMVKETAYDYIE